MVVHHFRQFGRRIFSLYDTHPLSMNSFAGGTVYILGEMVSQNQTPVPPSPKGGSNESINSENVQRFDWRKIGQVGALGAAENGIFMYSWYTFLTRFVGSSVATEIVLIKCALDQIFFASQQDFLFLALCAYNQFEKLPTAIEEVKKTFLTTWLMDCSLWPMVNFVGFAFVPFKFQPSYMAVVQFFWQVYISSVASASNNVTCNIDNNKTKVDIDEKKLKECFDVIDLDKNGFLDETELKAALKLRGITVKQEEINMMIKDGDTEVADGKISFDEFKIIAKKGSNLKSAGLWAHIHNEITLQKGAKAAIKRYEDLKGVTVSPAPVAATGVSSSSPSDESLLTDEQTDALKQAGLSVGILSAIALLRKIIYKI
eukprot:gene12609-16906_t